MRYLTWCGEFVELEPLRGKNGDGLEPLIYKRVDQARRAAANIKD